MFSFFGTIRYDCYYMYLDGGNVTGQEVSHLPSLASGITGFVQHTQNRKHELGCFIFHGPVANLGEEKALE